MKLFPLLVVLFVLFQFVRALITANKKGAAHEDQRDETEEQRRMREIQERIRKKIAERRAGGTPPMPPPAPVAPPELRPNPRAMPLPPQPVAQRPAGEAEVLARQAQLAEQLQSLAAARHAAGRRAANVATEKAAVESAAAPARAHADLLADLRGAQNLKRAIVLREILGTPVGLR